MQKFRYSRTGLHRHAVGSAVFSGMASAVQLFTDDLKRQIRNWTNGRVRNVAIEFRDRRIVVRGRAPTYHVKQLVLSGLAQFLPACWSLQHAIIVD
jgi:hypothetical protein